VIDATTAPPAPDRRPPWFARPSDIELDCRAIGYDGMTAFRAVITEAERLLPGQVLKIRIGFEPAFLCRVLAGRGFEHWPEQIEAGQWLIYFLRKPAGFRDRSAGASARRPRN
jgi:hypothetical protein